jgi:predicted acetyltransferase/predicted kinase
VTAHLVLMAGLPGAGKSTLAQALGKALGWPVIDKDVILSALLPCDIPETLAQPAAYATLLALGREMVVDQGRSVILDSPASWERTVTTAQDICRDGNAEFHVILCLADREIRNARVRARAAMLSQPTGVSRTAGTGVERFPHLPDDTIHVDTNQPIERMVRQVLDRLALSTPQRAEGPGGLRVELRQGRVDEKPIFANLLNLYLHDLSAYTGAGPDADGRFRYHYLDAYWPPEGQAEGRVPYLIHAEGELSGFVLKTRHSRLRDDASANSVAEFFVVRTWRRAGVGRRAACALFDLIPGRWEVAQLRHNTAARAFWRSVISDYTDGRFVEHQLADERWDGTVQEFVSGS